MRRGRISVIAGAFAALGAEMLGGCTPPAPPNWTSGLVSVNGAGSDSGNGQSGGALLDQFVVSPDGTKVAFQSTASNLGPTDTNGLTDIYVRDLTTGTTSLVSVSAAGTDSGNGASAAAGGGGGNLSFNADGTKLAFDSRATNLVSTPDTNGSGDVFVRDLVAGTTTLVSVAGAGTSAANSLSTTPVFAPSGDRVAFTSFGSNLTATDTNHTGDLYIRDLSTGTTTLVSVNGAGTDGGNGNSDGQANPAAFSPDGTKITFASSASNLGPTDTNGTTDGYLRDLTTGTTTLVSANAAGTDSGNARSLRGHVSPDGTKILFTSTASNLGPNDTNGVSDVYLRDLTTGTTTLVSRNAAGTSSGNAASSDARFSPDGSKVVFVSRAGDLGPTDANATADVYVRDLALATTSLVSVNAAGANSGNAASTAGWFSPGGGSVVFVSSASDLGPADTNAATDVYVRNLAAGTTALVSTSAAADNSGNSRSTDPAFAADDDSIVYASLASDLGPTDTNGLFDLYVATLPTEPCETTTTTASTTTSTSTTVPDTTTTTEATTTTTEATTTTTEATTTTVEPEPTPTPTPTPTSTPEPTPTPTPDGLAAAAAAC